MIIAFAGLPGSGKSFFAKELAKRFDNYTVLDKDVIRNTLFPGKLTVFTSEQDDFCIDVILKAAKMIIHNNPKMNVIIDGRTFAKKAQVDFVLNTCKENNIQCKFVEFTCSEAVALKRLNKDKNSHLAKNRDSSLYKSLKEKAEPIEIEHLCLSSEQEDDLEERIKVFLNYVK